MMQSISKTLLTAALLPATTLANYKLTKDYSGYDFFRSFDFYNGPDPTHGHVQYQGYASANATGLTGFLIMGSNSTNTTSQPPPIYLGVDYTTTYPTDVGRPSVRVSSVETFNHSLVIADILHMPSSTCGLWPAFWMLGSSASWPNAGEIDIVENVNDNNFNLMTLHTNAGVTISNDTTLFNGTVVTSNCDVSAKDQPANAGCSIKDNPETNSYGTNFNNIGGGIFAMQYTSEYIAIWFFPRNAIPDDIKSNAPLPPTDIRNASSSVWGRPNALFKPPSSTTTSTTSTTPTTATGNVIVPITTVTTTTSPTPSSVLDTHMQGLRLVIDTTFCGDWAGATWNSTSCGKLAPTCEEYVSRNPEAFSDAFWAIQAIMVFESDEKEGAGNVKRGIEKKVLAGTYSSKVGGPRRGWAESRRRSHPRDLEVR